MICFVLVGGEEGALDFSAFSSRQTSLHPSDSRRYAHSLRTDLEHVFLLFPNYILEKLLIMASDEGLGSIVSDGLEALKLVSSTR